MSMRMRLPDSNLKIKIVHRKQIVPDSYSGLGSRHRIDYSQRYVIAKYFGHNSYYSYFLAIPNVPEKYWCFGKSLDSERFHSYEKFLD